MEISYHIGIDLGTTYSCIAVYRNKNVDIIPNELSERTTPSVVCFTPYDILIGRKAKNQITKNFKNTIYDAKRLIGHRYSDEVVQNDKKNWPFTLAKDENDRPQIEASYKGDTVYFYAEEISALVLTNLKNSAEKYLGREIKDVVITVPARFNDSQRQATIDAAQIANLNVIHLVNEPTAAAIAYAFSNTVQGKKTILVFDLGGGTFDVSILELEHGNYVVKTTDGDTHLGGEDFDNKLMEYCIKEFKKETGLDVVDQKSKRRLKIACEETKITLSAQNETVIEVDSLVGDNDLNLTITREDFEDIISEYLTKIQQILERTLYDANIQKKDIDEVVLAGGSTRIPKVEEIIRNFFDEKEIKKAINADEAIAYGAAIYASTNDKNSNNNINITDVCPYSLGIGSKDREMSVMIPKNTQIPYKFTDQFYTIKDEQNHFGIGVYQGEGKIIDENTKLGSFFVRGIRKGKKGEVGIDLTFNLNKNGILNVSAVEIGGGSQGNLTVQCKGKNDLDVEKLKIKFKEIEKKEKERKIRVEARLNLENKVNSIKKEMKNLDASKRKNLKKLCDDITSWIKDHQDEEINVYKEKLKELEQNFNDNF